ncbi:MAG: DNA-3-methyladenine glycosylase 2 family protein [Deltaproteobacteria bacterium]|nr:DNA-3-methyladenine glycosylase 2 family protein [Deltaproteobacteria bacterium]
MKINTTHLSITPPAPFNFYHSARSHGWVVLAPNSWDEERRALKRVERLSAGKVVLLDISGDGTIKRPRIAIKVSHAGRLSQKEQNEVTAVVGRMFRADEDLSGFYALCKKRGQRWVKMNHGLGRLLRSPTVFEDVVKTICTTNIQWGGTTRMVEGLVNTLGEPYPGDSYLRAFPTPEAMAAALPETFNQAVRLGYRGDYVHTLARRVASGELDLEAFRDLDIPSPELKKKLLAIKGVGHYAAATLLMLLGRYDELAVDTGFRRFVSRKYFKGQRPSDREAQAIYEDWGRWKYLAFWFDRDAV